MSIKFTKELAVNAGLAFVGGFVTSFAAFLAATPRNPGFAAIVSAAAAAGYAGFRAVVGFAALNAKSIPTIVVDE